MRGFWLRQNDGAGGTTMANGGEKMADGGKTGAAKLFRWAEIEPEQMSPLLTRQFVSGEKAMLARIMLKAGCVVPEHSHPNEQIAMIVSGALEFVVAGVTQVVRAGEVLVIPAGVPHSARALEDTEDLDLFAPPRQDWMEGRDGYLR